MAKPAPDVETASYNFRDRDKKPPKQLDHLEVKEAENDGHVVTHHFTNYEHKPENHVFGKGQGEAMVSHIRENMGLPKPSFDGRDEDEPSREE